MFLGDRVRRCSLSRRDFYLRGLDLEKLGQDAAPAPPMLSKPNHESNKKSASQIAFITSNWNPKTDRNKCLVGNPSSLRLSWLRTVHHGRYNTRLHVSFRNYNTGWSPTRFP